MKLILGVVQAQKEGDIESKMIRLRRLEEVRGMRLVEAEKKEKERRGRLEGVKEGIKKEGRERRRMKRVGKKEGEGRDGDGGWGRGSRSRRRRFLLRESEEVMIG